MSVELAIPMPDSCMSCNLQDHDCECHITGSSFYDDKFYPAFDPESDILPDCPILRKIPDTHGDLVDRDDLYKAFGTSPKCRDCIRPKEMGKSCRDEVRNINVFCQIINELNPVIPAVKPKE